MNTIPEALCFGTGIVGEEAYQATHCHLFSRLMINRYSPGGLPYLANCKLSGGGVGGEVQGRDEGGIGSKKKGGGRFTRLYLPPLNGDMLRNWEWYLKQYSILLFKHGIFLKIFG